MFQVCGLSNNFRKVEIMFLSLSFFRLNAFAGLLFLLSGCATIQFGADFNPAAFQDWVKRGETTRSDVIQFLGQPVSEGAVMLGDGTELTRILYYYGKGKIHKMQNAKFKMLEVRFDSNNKVYSYNWSSSD